MGNIQCFGMIIDMGDMMRIVIYYYALTITHAKAALFGIKWNGNNNFMMICFATSAYQQKNHYALISCQAIDIMIILCVFDYRRKATPTSILTVTLNEIKIYEWMIHSSFQNGAYIPLIRMDKPFMTAEWTSILKQESYVQFLLQNGHEMYVHSEQIFPSACCDN